jgi:hypothetical protein
MTKISDLIVLDKIASANGDVASTDQVLSAKSVKRGTIIEMGIGGDFVGKLTAGTHIAVLYVVNKEEFFKLKNEG